MLQSTFRILLSLGLMATVLAGCGRSPIEPARPARNIRTGAAIQSPMGGVPGQLGQPGQAIPGAVGGDAKTREILAKVAQARQINVTADATLKINYVKDDGSKAWIRSRYRYQKPAKNSLELLGGSDTKVEGTKLIWTAKGKVQVRTKFIGFWINTSLGLEDQRLKNPVGHRIDETAIDMTFDTILHPQATVKYIGDGNNAGKPMSMLEVVSPLMLQPATKEIYGIDQVTGAVVLRDMFQGTKLFYHMVLESSKVNPKLTSADFSL